MPGTSPITEGVGAASFTITTAPASDPFLNLTVAEAGGSDFVAADDEGMQMVTIPTGGSATYTFAAVNDETDESNSSVTVTIVDCTGYTVRDPVSAMVTVNNNDEEMPLGQAIRRKTWSSSTLQAAIWRYGLLWVA